MFSISVIISDTATTPLGNAALLLLLLLLLTTQQNEPTQMQCKIKMTILYLFDIIDSDVICNNHVISRSVLITIMHAAY
jgi:hypothetical protein